MLIHEKSLATHLKRCYKNAGYRVMECDERTTIATAQFVAVYATDNLPRSILGLIAEHTGAILCDIAYMCNADGSQLILREAVTDIIKEIDPVGDHLNIYPTPLWWENRRIMQREDRVVAAVSGELLKLVQDNDAIPFQIEDKSLIGWESGTERLYILAQTVRENLQLSALQTHCWELL